MSEKHQGFTPEQQAYLASVVAKLNLHKLLPQAATSGSSSADMAEPPTVYGTAIDDLCREEVAKHTMHPLDLWRQLEEWTAEDKIAEGLDQFLLRHLGFFNVEPNSTGYMMRLRAPANVLRSDQMMVLADIAEELAGGYAHVTTRGSLQIREIRPANVIEIIERMEEVSLTAQGTGADSARNLTVTPSAGFDPLELIDMTKYAKRLSIRILRTRELQGIPRKFNISFDNAGSLSCLSDTNDIGFLAVTVRENDQGVEPGMWCRIHLGGITGHKDFARDTGLLCRPDETVDVSEAMLRVFVEHGDRTNRKKARLKYLLEGQGVDWFIERTQEKLDSFNSGIKLVSLDRTFDEPRAPIDRQGHIGVYPQRQTGFNYVGAALELGRLSPDQMRLLAKLADDYGRGEIRLTVWQNPLIPHVSDIDTRTVAAELEKAGMPARASAFAAGAVACTGKWGCKLASAYTKQDALRVVRHLESRLTLDSPINIHLTGCPNSCAQHYIGDIGLVGASAPGGGEGYNIVIGGGSDQDQGLARPLCGPVAAADIDGIIENVVGNYLDRRAGRQTFLDFVRALPDEELGSLLQDRQIADRQIEAA
ncbi:MAG: NirA family protein [Pseudomonadota bacterium]